jgi:hypothetical protein
LFDQRCKNNRKGEQKPVGFQLDPVVAFPALYSKLILERYTLNNKQSDQLATKIPEMNMQIGVNACASEVEMFQCVLFAKALRW